MEKSCVRAGRLRVAVGFSPRIIGPQNIVAERRLPMAARVGQGRSATPRLLVPTVGVSPRLPANVPLGRKHACGMKRARLATIDHAALEAVL